MDASTSSPITPELWARLLQAFDAGVPPWAACRYAGIPLAVWEAECQRIPEFGTEAGKVEMSGLVAAWMFLQRAAASEWRAALQLIKLYGSTRTREVGGLHEPGDDDPSTNVTPADVAAVIRILGADREGGGVGDGRPCRMPSRGVRVALEELEHDSEQQSGPSLQRVRHRSRDRRQDLLRGSVRHRPDRLRHRFPRGAGTEQAGEAGGPAGKQPVQRRPRHARGGGQLVHRQLREAMAADELQGGLQEQLACRRRRRAAGFTQQRLAAAEQAVEGPRCDTRRRGKLLHRRLPASGTGTPGGCDDLLS
jgi:hypothetical protein